MSKWSDAAKSLFADRHIDLDVAANAGVEEKDGWLQYPTGKRRSLNGGGHANAHGSPARPWWLRGTPERAESVLITEGETDGLAALTALNLSPEAPGYRDLPILAVPGCQYPADRLVQGFRRYGTREVFVCLDADDKSRPAAEKMAATLRSGGVRAIPVVLPEGHDLASWLMEDGDPESFVHLLADAEQAEEQARRGPTFADVQGRDVSWLWRNRIPAGRITVVAGDPGVGKSTFTCLLAAELSREGKYVLMANGDDEPEDVKPRLATAGADFTRIQPLMPADESWVVPQDIAKIRERVILTDARLLVLDPWDGFANIAQAHRRNEVYRALKPLQRMAAKENCAVVLVCHLNRPDEHGSALYRIPVGLRDIARSVLSMKNGKEVTLEHSKSTRGSLQPDLTYRFDGDTLTEVGIVIPQDGDTNWDYRETPFDG